MGEGCTGKLPIMYLSHKPVLWFGFVGCCVWILLGSVGNCVSYLILGYNKSRRNQSCGFYLRALAVADCSALLFSTGSMSVQMMLRPAMRLSHLNPISLLVNSYPGCNLRMFLSYATSLVATFIIVLFSLERCLVVAMPLRFMNTFTLSRARAAVCVLVLASCLACTPALFSFTSFEFWSAESFNASCVGAGDCERMQRLNDIAAQFACRTCSNCSRPGGASWGGSRLICTSTSLCRINLDVFKGFAVFHTIAQSAVALIITAVCNAVIIVTMRRRDSQRLSSSSSDDSQDKQITIRLILVSTVFIILSFPLTVFHVVTHSMSGSYCNPLAADALTITLMLNAGNFAANFYIYCISEQQFRKVALAVLKCKRHRLSRLLSYANEPIGKQRNRRRSTTPTKSASALQVTSSSNVRRSSNSSAIDTAVGQQQDQGQQQALIDTTAADYVRTRHQLQRQHSEEHQEEEEEEKNCDNCSMAREDWSSSMFTEGDSHRPAVVRWSEVAPE